MSEKRRPTGFIRTKKTKTKGSRYYAFVVFEGREESLGPFGSRDNAMQRLREAEREIERGTFGRGEPTLNEFYQEWITAKARTLKDTTLRDYTQTFESYILPDLGEMKLVEISPRDVQKWIDRLPDLPARREEMKKKGEKKKPVKKLGAASINKAFRYFRNITNNAALTDVIDRSPCRGAIVPRPSKETEFDILSIDEVRQVLDVADDPERTLIAVLAFAGLRIGEALGLKWKDVDFTQHCIRVERTWTKYSTWSTPKSKSSRRAVFMADSLAALLADFYEAAGRPGPDAVLFTHDGSRPLDSSHARRSFDAALKVAGLRHVRIHDLRHTFATTLLSSGASIKWLQAQLGHSSASMTLDIYSHYVPESGVGAIAAFNALIDGSVAQLPAPGKADKRRK
jgi:integrase